MANEYIAFVLTTTLALFALVVFVFAFVKLKTSSVKNIFRLFFFSSLIFAVSQVALLVSTLNQGFNFNLFLNINAFFSFIMSILLIMTIREAEDFSKKILTEGKQNAP